jgi:FdrA protein
VIGYGAHDNPAAHLAAVVADRADDAPILVASVTGTELDRQVRSAQIRLLEDAGIVVAPSNAQACEFALALSANDVRIPRYANS